MYGHANRIDGQDKGSGKLPVLLEYFLKRAYTWRMTTSDEHLWLSDLRKNPGGEVRLFSAEGKLISGTYAFQVTRSIDAMTREVTRKPRTITTVEELAGLMDGTVIIDGDPICCERIGGQWYVPAAQTPYGDREIILPATVIHEPEAEVGA